MGDILESIAEWSAGLTWDDIPEDVRKRAIQALSDTVSTMAGGASTIAAKIALDFASGLSGDAPLVSRGAGAAPTHAAFGNGVAASALDFDDGHYLAGAIHPGAVIVPAVLALADSATTISDAIVAQVVGYEIGLRAAHLLWPKHELDHYHATGCAGAIGAAAAAAKLIGLDAEGIARAIKIGWAHAPMSTFGTPMVKESIGWGAMTGVAAARLAQAGFMKVPDGYVIDVNDIVPPSPFHQPGAAEDPFITSIGTTYEVLNTYFKSFGACRYTHAAGVGFVELLDQYQIVPEEIVSITVATHRAATFLGESAPKTIEAAQYSFPIVLGSLARWGAVGAREMDLSQLDDPERLAIASKVTVEHDPSLDRYYPARYPSRVDIETASGTVSDVFLDAPGDPGSSFGDEQLREKWELLLAPLGDAEAGAMLDGMLEPSAKLLDTLAPLWAVPA